MSSLLPSIIPYIAEETRRQPWEALWIFFKDLRPLKTLENIFLGHKMHTQIHVYINSLFLLIHKHNRHAVLMKRILFLPPCSKEMIKTPFRKHNIHNNDLNDTSF